MGDTFFDYAHAKEFFAKLHEMCDNPVPHMSGGFISYLDRAPFVTDEGETVFGVRLGYESIMTGYYLCEVSKDSLWKYATGETIEKAKEAIRNLEKDL